MNVKNFKLPNGEWKNCFSGHMIERMPKDAFYCLLFIYLTFYQPIFINPVPPELHSLDLYPTEY